MKALLLIKVLGIGGLLAGSFFLLNINGNKTYKPESSNKEELLAVEDSNFGIEKTYLLDKTGGEGYATARRTYTGERFIFSLEMQYPEQTGIFNVWLYDEMGDKMLLGTLENDGQNYYFEYETGRDLRKFNIINIIEESGLDSRTIMEGQFNGSA